jgi:hypothetical protein
MRLTCEHAMNCDLRSHKIGISRSHELRTEAFSALKLLLVVNLVLKVKDEEETQSRHIILYYILYYILYCIHTYIVSEYSQIRRDCTLTHYQNFILFYIILYYIILYYIILYYIAFSAGSRQDSPV